MARRPGQPTRYDPTYCAQLVAHMSGGLSFAAFAAKIGVCRDTLYEWASKHRAFSDAKKRGEAASLLWWEQLGQAAALGIQIKSNDGKTTIDGKKVSPALWIFTMKCRFRAEGWAEDPPPDDDRAKRRSFGFNYARKAR